MNETIEDKISKLFNKAYEKNELYEYLVGIGDYKITFKDSPNYDYNDIGLMQRGINNYISKTSNVNVENFINSSLIKYLSENDAFKISIVLDFILYYVKYSKKETYNFNINLDIILPLLKEKLLILRQVILDTKSQSDINPNLWQSIQNRCDLFEIRTGHKIL